VALPTTVARSCQPLSFIRKNREAALRAVEGHALDDAGEGLKLRAGCWRGHVASVAGSIGVRPVTASVRTPKRSKWSVSLL
jgi:hypothetical protein